MLNITTNITDKGYILLPFRVRKALKLKPKQAVNIKVVGNKVEVTPMPTLEEVFSFFKPTSRRFTQKELKAEEKSAHDAIAENAVAEGL